MIITRTPFRITLGGGGTDLPAYYSKYGGFICAASINKYMFINLNKPVVDDLIRVKYTKSETVEHRDQLQHEIAKAALQMTGIEKAVEIVSMSDVPAGTGLGSSSCYAVGLLNALHTMKREHIPLQQLAEEACHLEIDLLGKPIGKQDQYMASFGGLMILEIAKDGRVSAKSVNMSDAAIDDLNRNMLMFYTNTSRDADTILAEQSKGAQKQKRSIVESMHTIKEIGHKIVEALETDNITDVGLLFDKHWQYKKKISTKMTNPHFNSIYELAKQNGALGGKISGAGGGGFFVFYVEEKHGSFREQMKNVGLREMRYRFDFEGTKVLVNFMDGVR